MGKIMMNGKQYGVGGLERAEDISYDNTQSGMSATNVQGAVDELKSGLKVTDFTSNMQFINCTSNDSSCVKIGSVVIVTFDITISTSISAYTTIISNIPSAHYTANAVVVAGATTTPAFIVGSGIGLREQMSANTKVRGSIVYASF